MAECGMQIDQFTAIINPPEVAILAVGTAEDVPVVAAGQITEEEKDAIVSAAAQSDCGQKKK